MCWFLPLSPGAAGQDEAEDSPHPSGCPRDPSPFQGLPWSTPGCVPPSQGALSPQPCPGSLTISLYQQLDFWPPPARQSKAKPFSFPLLLQLHFDVSGALWEEDAFPFLSIRSTHSAARLSPSPALLSSQLPSQTKMCELFDLPGSPHWGIGSGVNYTQPGPGWRDRELSLLPASYKLQGARRAREVPLKPLLM